MQNTEYLHISTSPPGRLSGNQAITKNILVFPLVPLLFANSKLLIRSIPTGIAY